MTFNSEEKMKIYIQVGSMARGGGHKIVQFTN